MTNKKNVSKIIIPHGVKEIEDSAFFEFEYLTEIVISNSVTKIGISAFFRCTSLRSIIIPDSVIEIGRLAFNQCKSLKNIILSDNLKIIGTNAFANCESLEKIDIPGSVKRIDNFAFDCCYSLKNVIIQNGVKEIGLEAFYGCDRLNNLTIPGSVTFIEMNAFPRRRELTIHTPVGSSAEVYAKNHGMTVANIDKSDHTMNRKIIAPDLLELAKRHASEIPPSNFCELQKALNITEEETRSVYFITKVKESVDIDEETALNLIAKYYGCSETNRAILYNVALQMLNHKSK